MLAADFRSRTEDFLVEELAGFEPAGQGEHLLLTVEKRGLNTVHAARRLARWAGIPDVGVGYAGLKDRHAVTRQRFSVHLPKRVAPDLATLQDESLRVLEHAWHHRKLPRGALCGNRFELVLRQVKGEREAVDRRLEAIARGGLPNYFGEQRFGRDGDNVESARRMFAGQRVRREQRSIYLSAARSAMFNAVLSARVGAGDWATGREGEVWMLEGSQSVFGPEAADGALADRAGRLDIHPTGPLWGRGELRCTGDCRDLELAVVEAFPDLRQGLEEAGLKQERRALRVRVAGLDWDWPGDDRLVLRFELPPGAYATGLLAELGEVRDAHAGAGPGG
ncbi:tRNA pseudouridine synthase D [Arenimonas soli]|uniref:tRNA pseudouridine synthase D n=1 Tax=Arenimonas soli TaxID=2269504 RepID=A0ABQ1HD45_9GAMM|nr:tRNA pseudouridine synthase D [Arenimonas soli]